MHIWHLQSSSYSFLHQTQLRALLLRYCRFDLEELQCGAKLMVLDLSFSSIYKLPRRVGLLTKLKVLILQHTRNIETIEVDVILNLSALEIWDTRISGYKWPTMRKSESKEVVLQDLSRLMSLKEVYLRLADMEAIYEQCNWMERLKTFHFNYGDDIIFDTVDCVKMIDIRKFRGNEIGSFILHAEKITLDEILGNVNDIFANFKPKNQSNSKLKTLHITGSFSKELTRLVPRSSILPNLEFLHIGWNKQVRSLYQVANALGTTFPKLGSLDIIGCSELENVFPSDFAHMVLPKLQGINIGFCDILTEVFHGNPAKNQVVVPKLKRLVLDNLKSLCSLCSYESSEQWQSLKLLIVKECPMLKKLPHMSSIKEIRGTGEWWSNLEWENTETKHTIVNSSSHGMYEVGGMQFPQSRFGRNGLKWL